MPEDQVDRAVAGAPPLTAAQVAEIRRITADSGLERLAAYALPPGAPGAWIRAAIAADGATAG